MLSPSAYMTGARSERARDAVGRTLGLGVLLVFFLARWQGWGFMEDDRDFATGAGLLWSAVLSGGDRLGRGSSLLDPSHLWLKVDALALALVPVAGAVLLVAPRSRRGALARWSAVAAAAGLACSFERPPSTFPGCGRVWVGAVSEGRALALALTLAPALAALASMAAERVRPRVGRSAEVALALVVGVYAPFAPNPPEEFVTLAGVRATIVLLAVAVVVESLAPLRDDGEPEAPAPAASP
jgi:hypothetical protein